jgi:hypothetical protein
MASIYTKRLTKELRGSTDFLQLKFSILIFFFLDLNKNPPEGVVVEEADNLKK